MVPREKKDGNSEDFPKEKRKKEGCRQEVQPSPSMIKYTIKKTHWDTSYSNRQEPKKKENTLNLKKKLLSKEW